MLAEFRYRLSLRIDSTESVVALASACFDGATGIEPEVSRRKLDISKTEGRNLFVEKQKLKTNLSILDEKILKAEKEQKTREVDYELFLEKHPPRELTAIDRIFFWRSVAIRNREEDLLKKKSEPVRIARELKNKLVKDKEAIVSRIESIEREMERNERMSSALERQWLDGVLALGIDASFVKTPTEALNFLRSRTAEYGTLPTIAFLNWFIAAIVLERTQNETGMGGDVEPSSALQELNELAYRSTVTMDEAGESALSSIMKMISSGRTYRQSDIPVVLPDHFKNVDLSHAFEICKAMMGFLPAPTQFMPVRMQNLIRLLVLTKPVESSDGASVEYGEAKGAHPFQPALESGLAALIKQEVDSGIKPEKETIQGIGNAKTTIERGDFARAFRIATPYMADTVTAILGHYAILAECPDDFLSMLENESIDIIVE